MSITITGGITFTGAGVTLASGGGGGGTTKAIFGYGIIAGYTAVSMTNLVSNTGVVANDTTGVVTAREGLAAAGYSLS